MSREKAKAPSDFDLMLHHDGELEGPEAAAAAERLMSDPEARAKVEALGQMGEMVRTHLELAADDADHAFDDLWERIEHRITANGSAEAPAVVAPQRPARAEGVGERGFFGVIAAWFDTHRGHIMTGAASAAAVAILILLLRPTERVVEREVVQTAPPRPTITAPAALQSQPPEIEYLEVVGGSSTVLALPAETEDGTEATVIWMMPDESTVEGPI